MHPVHGIFGEIAAKKRRTVCKHDLPPRARIAGGKAEASEFTVDDPALTGKRLRDLRLRPGIIVAGLLRDKEFILPDGSTELRAGDSAIVISARYKFARLGDILLHSGDRA